MPCCTAVAASSHRPPSENESGVTLTTPMTRQRSCGQVGQHGHLACRDEAHGLGSGGRVAQLAAHGAGDGLGAALAHAAHRHAQVLGLDHDDDAARVEVLDERVGDLRREPLLHLRAAGEDVDEPGQLGQPRDPAALGGM